MNNNNDCIKERQDYVICEKNGKKITVRDLQLEVLTIMDEIHRVCEKNNIRYALIAGSALGIANYKGFIPWDDDIDICILREDWDKFIDALNRDLSDDFYFQCFENKFNTKLLRKTWYKYENLVWTRFDYYYLENGELSYKHEQHDDEEETSYTERIWGQFERWAEIQSNDEDSTITATQVSENKIVITFQRFESEYQDGIRIEIVDGYIDKVYEVYGDGVLWDYGTSYSYNVEGLEIPPIPNQQ